MQTICNKVVEAKFDTRDKIERTRVKVMKMSFNVNTDCSVFLEFEVLF